MSSGNPLPTEVHSCPDTVVSMEIDSGPKDEQAMEAANTLMLLQDCVDSDKKIKAQKKKISQQVPSELAKAGKVVKLSSKQKKLSCKWRTKIPMKLFYENLVMKQTEPKVTGDVITSFSATTQENEETQVSGTVDEMALQKKVNDHVIDKFQHLLHMRVCEQLSKNKLQVKKADSAISTRPKLPEFPTVMEEQALESSPKFSKIAHDHSYSLSPAMAVRIEHFRNLVITKPKTFSTKLKAISKKHKKRHYSNNALHQRIKALRTQKSIANARETVKRRNTLIAEYTKLAKYLAMPMTSSEAPIEPVTDSESVALKEVDKNSSPSASPVKKPTESSESSETSAVLPPEAMPEAPTVLPEIPPVALSSPPSDVQSLLSTLPAIPKGLNLPVLEFLKMNFPALRFDNVADVIQINTLLAQTLQMQQKVLQTQESVLGKTLAPSTPVPAQPTPAANKPTVLVQVLPQQQQPKAEVSPALPVESSNTTPAPQEPVVPPKSLSSLPPVPTEPSAPGPVPSSAQPPSMIGGAIKPAPEPVLSSAQPPSMAGGAIKPSPDTKTSLAKSKAVRKAKSAVEKGDEMMEIDVVHTLTPIDLPDHLKDHSYALYNPAEGESEVKQKKIAGYRGSSVTIHPARISYAPPLPDSPTMLYKLLKINPRKNVSRAAARSCSTKLDKSMSHKPKQGRFTPSGGSRSRRTTAGGARKERGGRGSKASSQAQSEEGSVSSASENSETESVNTNRRRSQRFSGRRKRYVDDVNVSLSDEDTPDVIPNHSGRLPKGRPAVDEDTEYLNDGESNGKSKAKSNKAAPINPTEGFQYSDIYFEPPAEDAEVVERILSTRTRETRTPEEEVKYGTNMEEYFVKYKSYSYLHAKWATFDKLLSGDKRFEGKLKRYRAKLASQGVFDAMDDELFNPEYTVVDRVLDKATQEEAGGEVVVHYLVKWCSLPYEDSTWELQEDVDDEAVRLYHLRSARPVSSEYKFVSRPPPSGFKQVKNSEYRDGNKLRSYQLEGVNWLLFNWYTRQNCILADEMGLGKTVQSIALLQEIHDTGIKGPFLVIVPLSTIANWQREAESWTEFNVVVYHGSAYSRRLIHEYEMYHRHDNGTVIPNTYKFDLLITTYEIILSDDSELQDIQWRVVIIDEAHRLKNRNCKLLEELKAIDMEHRVLLTGTPLQNSVEELFSLLNFLEPSTFHSHQTFLQQFGELKTDEQVKELKAILKPMMLRRLKEDVEKTLAPKEETIVEVELTVLQKQYYRAILERNFTFLSKPGGGMPSLLNVMMELRKCCNHPFLIKGAEQHIVEDYQRRHPNESPHECLVQASGKLVLISKLLPKLKANGHKVLIFSQMVRCLDMLEDFLRMRGYLYERIDGNVRGPLRQAAIDRFSKPNSDRFVFLLCTRAGGLGINLTAADTVIIYDSDWNPQNDLQAQARCHRIGQNKPVKAYRLITRNTYERDMFDRASLKLGLDKAVLQSSGSASTGSGPPQLSKKEVEDLLRKGAYGALLDEDDDANKFCEEDIDQILERRTQVIQIESQGKGSTFAKASFSADGSTDITIDDPNFWQKWAEKAQLDLDELANKDTLVIDTPRLRRQVRRYGNDNQEEVIDMGEIIDEVVDLIPSRGKQGWTKLECLKVEKGLLTYGWANWRTVIKNTTFNKRQLGAKDIENIARNILVFCSNHFTGDEKVVSYVNRLVDPDEVTETEQDDHVFYQAYTKEELLELRGRDPDTLFEDSSYMKHLTRHSNKILLRVRQLHILRWSILSSHYSDIVSGVPVSEMHIDLPKPEEPPPAPWWSVECDYSLLVGIIKHGYEMFGLMRADKALCFRALCGEEPKASSKKKKAAIVRAAALAAKTRSAHNQDSEGSAEESDWDEGPAEEPVTRKEAYRATKRGVATGTQYSWPMLADVNTRARRYVTAWLRHLKKEEIKQQNIQKSHDKREKEAEYQRKKELRKAELAQKWSRREEQDFARVATYYGVVFNPEENQFDWSHFRILASLTKKTDERLTLYFHDLKKMCWRVLKKKKPPSKRGLSGIAVEPLSEEKAARCLQRINLLSAIREEILPHKEFGDLMELCEFSFEVPSWWVPVVHDIDLIKGVAEHGLLHSEDLIYNNPRLCFKSSIPKNVLYDPNQDDDEDSSSDEEDDEGIRQREDKPSNPVPVGWPKEKAIVIRLSRIVYAFRHRVWPRPMEGLDLFVPVVTEEGSSSSESEYDVVTSDEELGHGPRTRHKEPAGTGKNFEVEKSVGLKLTLKKSTRLTRSAVKNSPQPDPPEAKLIVRIPTVKLSFASSAGMKRIPRKRSIHSVDVGQEETRAPAKRQRKSTPRQRVMIVDPATVTADELTGLERVAVINRNTHEKLSLSQSPMLKNLSLWLEGHPHFSIDTDWGDLVIQWGALAPDMHYKVLRETT